jgi:phenylpyruvate tautomerase
MTDSNEKGVFMPLLKLQFSEELSVEKKESMHKRLCEIVSGIFSKPPSYIMVIIEKTDISMAGNSGNASFIELRSIGGITPKNTAAFAESVTRYVNAETGIPSDRIFINFSDIPGTLWGWNGSTFG